MCGTSVTAAPLATRPPRIPEDLARGVAAVRAGHAAARMGARAAQVQPVGSACGSSPIPAHGPQEQQLVGRHVAVQRVAAGQPHQPLHVQRRHHLTMLDQVGQLREVLGDRRDRPVRTIVLDVVPRSLAQPVGLGVHVDRDDVLALGRERRIVHGREAQFDVRGVGRDPLHGLRLLRVHVGDERVQLHDPGVVGLHAALGQSPPRTAAREAPRLILMLVPMQRYASIRARNVLGQVGGVAQRQERPLRVRVRQHPARADLLAAREPHADGATAAASARARPRRRTGSRSPPRARRRPSPR